MNGFLYGFQSWFRAFFGNMLDGILTVFKGLFYGVSKIFDFPYYFRLFTSESQSFGVLDWILAILAFLLSILVWVALFFLLGLGIRRYIRYKKSLAVSEDLLEEIADLHRMLTGETDGCTFMYKLS